MGPGLTGHISQAILAPFSFFFLNSALVILYISGDLEIINHQSAREQLGLSRVSVTGVGELGLRRRWASPVVMRRRSWSLKKLQQKRGGLYLGKTLPTLAMCGGEGGQ